VQNESQETYSIQGMIVDLDGVIWRGESLLHGAVSFFKELNQRSIPYVIATNNASTTPEHFFKRAQTFGLDVQQERILTSAQAAVHFLHDQFPNAASVFAIGEEGLLTALTEGSFRLTNSSKGVQAVVVGMDRNLTWQKLSEAAYAIQAGALFLGTNSDPSYPTERGFALGTGAILQALQMTTGIQPIVVGKPEPYLFLQALEKLGTRPSETLVLGDRLSTDILGGIRAGLLTALLLTGVTTGYDLQNSSIQPDLVFQDLNDLIRGIWKESE
jgi:4-nitrophenyl phosphatase